MADVGDLLMLSELLDLVQEGWHIVLAHMLEGIVPEFLAPDIKGLMAGAVLVSSVIGKEDIVSHIN